jgi:hypothetical protein
MIWFRMDMCKVRLRTRMQNTVTVCNATDDGQ